MPEFGSRYVKDFSALHFKAGYGAHPASYIMRIGVFSLGLKRLGREANHSPPTKAEAKNAWMYTHTPSNVFMA
jgi:hypothetical protein